MLKISGPPKRGIIMEYIYRLKQFRQENKITQERIAKILNIPQTQYLRYETGRNELPIRYLVAICKEYSIDANWLLGLTETPQP